MLPTPQEMIAHMDRYLHGQKQAKRDLAVSVYNHYLGIAYAESTAGQQPDDGPNHFGSQHVLLMGPTGAGKTFLVKTLARYLGVPVAFCTATSYVQAGYKGELIEGMIDILLAAAGNDPERAKRGIIFIDEIDKIRSRADVDLDVSGAGVQNSLLTLLDGREIQGVDTSNLLFIATGAFVDLADIVRFRMRNADRPLGFHPPASEDVPDDLDKILQSEFAALCNVEHEDLVEFGYIPEFIGRFAVLSAVRELSPSELVAILTETEDSVVARQKRLFALHNIELTFEDAALNAIAAEAERLHTGARALTRIVLKALHPVDSILSELMDQRIRKIRITEDTVRLRKPPKMETDEADRAPNVSARPDGPSPGRRLAELRQRAIPESFRNKGPKLSSSPTATGLPPGITDVRGMESNQIELRLSKTESQIADPETTAAALKWWQDLKKMNDTKLGLILRLAEELRNRDATLNEFYDCYQRSGVDGMQANLLYLDFLRLKQAEAKKNDEFTIDSWDFEDWDADSAPSEDPETDKPEAEPKKTTRTRTKRKTPKAKRSKAKNPKKKSAKAKTPTAKRPRPKAKSQEPKAPRAST